MLLTLDELIRLRNLCTDLIGRTNPGFPAGSRKL